MAFDADEIAHLKQALEALLTLKHGGRGTLNVGSGQTKGRLVVFNGFIVSAEVNGTSLLGEEAVNHLMSLDECVVSLIEDEQLKVEEVACHIKLQNLLRLNTSPSTTDSQNPIPSSSADAPPATMEPLSSVSEDTPAAKNETLSSSSGQLPAITFSPRSAPDNASKETLPKITTNLAKRTSENPFLHASSSPAPSPGTPMPDLSKWTSSAGSEDNPNNSSVMLPADTPWEDTDTNPAGFIYVNIAETKEKPDAGVLDLSPDEVWASTAISEDNPCNTSVIADRAPEPEELIEPPVPLPDSATREVEELENSLTPQQRELLEAVKGLSDPELFFEKTKELEMPDEERAVLARYRELLKKVRLEDNPTVFEVVSPELQKPQLGMTFGTLHREEAQKARLDRRSIDEKLEALAEKPSLNASQKALLDLVSELTDLEGFDERGEVLSAPNELAIEEETKWSLEEMARARTLEQQKTEFGDSDGALAREAEKGSLKDFKEYALDEIPTPVIEEQPPDVLPSDKEKLVLLVPEPEPAYIKQERKGIIGRLKDAIERRKIAVYEGPMPSAGPQLGHIVGRAVLVVICVALFTVPNMMRTAFSRADSPDVARAQMRLVVNDDMDNFVPYVQHEVEKPVVNRSTGMTHSSPPAISETVQYSQDSLMSARWLASKGHYESAAKSYESYLEDNPDSIAVRLELINFYLQHGNKERARWHCLRGMKSKCSGSDLERFWALWRQAIV